MESKHITGVRTVSIPVESQDDALRFYTGLGFALLRDVSTPSGRWIELAPGSGNVILTVERAAPNTTRGAIAIRFTSDDVVAAHAAMIAGGIDVDDILRWPGVPAMFAFRDPTATPSPSPAPTRTRTRTIRTPNEWRSRNEQPRSARHHLHRDTRQGQGR